MRAIHSSSDFAFESWWFHAIRRYRLMPSSCTRACLHDRQISVRWSRRWRQCSLCDGHELEESRECCGGVELRMSHSNSDAIPLIPRNRPLDNPQGRYRTQARSYRILKQSPKIVLSTFALHLSYHHRRLISNTRYTLFLSFILFLYETLINLPLERVALASVMRPHSYLKSGIGITTTRVSIISTNHLLVRRFLLI